MLDTLTPAPAFARQPPDLQRPWLASYPSGVPADIAPGRYTSVAAIFDEACTRYAEASAFISFGAHLSYADLESRARDFAAWLQSLGLPRGTRIALMMPNLLQYPVCLYGALRAGFVVVNCNPLYTAPELVHQLKDSGAELIVIVENFAATLQQALPQLPALRHIVVTAMGDLLGRIRGPLINLAIRRVRKLVPPWQLPQAHTLPEVLAAGQRCRFEAPALTHDDLAMLQYTGGTTGVAKGAMLSHGNIVANVCQAHAWIHPWLHDGEELVVTALPLYHIFAFTANCLTFVRLGATNLLIANPRDIAGFVKTLRRYRFTAFTGVNTLFNALLNHPGFAGLDFSQLRCTLGGGMAVQEPVARRWLEVTGSPLTQAYGLTETSPAVTINPLSLHRFNASIGLPISSTEVSIRDERGAPRATGEIGEICVRGPQVCAGYWQRPEDTRLTFWDDGALRTGDLGYLDPQGFVFLVDRKKDMILVSGFNVYPNEVEAALAQHPGVAEVAVIGVPDERTGEAVKAFVVRQDPSVDAAALREHCQTLLTGYKIPHHFEFREELPKSNVGKILRRALKEC